MSFNVCTKHSYTQIENTEKQHFKTAVKTTINRKKLKGVKCKMLERQEREFIHELYSTYSQSLWGYAYYLSDNQEMSDDIIQTVFLNAMKHCKTLKNIEKPSQLKAYLNTATRNTFYNVKKSEKHYTDTIPYKELEKQGSSENLYEEVESADYLQSMISILTQREQDMLSLYYFVGLSHKQVAEVMHLSVTNTKVTLHNIRKKLKKQIEQTL